MSPEPSDKYRAALKALFADLAIRWQENMVYGTRCSGCDSIYGTGCSDGCPWELAKKALDNSSPT